MDEHRRSANDFSSNRKKKRKRGLFQNRFISKKKVQLNYTRARYRFTEGLPIFVIRIRLTKS